MSIQEIIHHRATAAFTKVGVGHALPIVQVASRPEFGDYQINGVMGAAKSAKIAPRALAEKIVAAINLSDIADTVTIAGPGFINVHLSTRFITEHIIHNLADSRLGASTKNAGKVLIDYSSPNLAKEMHVGHLRSTIIGDALVRILSFVGHSVVRANHVGDWGTQFGMLTAHMVECSADGHADMVLADLEAFYREAKARFDNDTVFADKARAMVVALQSGDREVFSLWQQFVSLSLTHCGATYDKLGVLLTPEDVRGESAYNDDLPKVVEELTQKGLLVTDDGAKVVFLPEFPNAEGNPQAMIIQKQGGGYLYATTDLATLRYRGALGLSRILYVVDARQSLHFQQLFSVGKKAGYLPDSVSAEHIAFGTVMGEDGKPFKTRTGGIVKLSNLLDEAIVRAYALAKSKNPDMSEEALRTIAESVGIGAVKYADLSKARQSDYIFSWESMLSFEGNTAPYLLYAYTRVQSIFARHPSLATLIAAPIVTRSTHLLSHSAERTLAVALLQFSETIEAVEKTCQPHHLCTYLYGVATQFSRFYEACPISHINPSGNENEATQAMRVKLAHLTAETLKTGLGLLGIRVLSSM